MLCQIKKGSARIIFKLFSKTSISLSIGVKTEAFFTSVNKKNIVKCERVVQVRLTK